MKDIKVDGELRIEAGDKVITANSHGQVYVYTKKANEDKKVHETTELGSGVLIDKFENGSIAGVEVI